jgi:hypothetical protein
MTQVTRVNDFAITGEAMPPVQPLTKVQEGLVASGLGG